MRKRILLASDLHHCHLTWYGLSSEERMERLIRDLNAEYRRDPYEVILFLGDYSLDFWEWDTKGCYLNEGRSYTREFVEKVCPRLPSPYLMIPGNHEQYGEDMWRSLTGCSRKGVWTTDGWLFILLDNFSANLDPKEHSDGTFTPIDVDFVREQMDAYPDRRVVLCSHHFDFEKETPEGCRLVQDPRIVCLASGHVHLSDIVTLPDALGGKKDPADRTLFLCGCAKSARVHAWVPGDDPHRGCTLFAVYYAGEPDCSGWESGGSPVRHPGRGSDSSEHGRGLKWTKEKRCALQRFLLP